MLAEIDGTLIRLDRGPAQQDGEYTERAVEYKDLLRSRIGSSDGANLHNHARALDPNAIVFDARGLAGDGRPGPVMAGFHAVWLTAAKVELRGAVTDPGQRRRGVATALVAWAVLWLCECGATEIACQVRVYPEGHRVPEQVIGPDLQAPINLPAYLLFRTIGLVGSEIATFQIVGDCFDRHLKLTAESGQGARLAQTELAEPESRTYALGSRESFEPFTYRSLIMHGTRAQVTKSAKVALQSVLNGGLHTLHT